MCVESLAALAVAVGLLIDRARRTAGPGTPRATAAVCAALTVMGQAGPVSTAPSSGERGSGREAAVGGRDTGGCT